jgi:hypothetical protein
MKSRTDLPHNTMIDRTLLAAIQDVLTGHGAPWDERSQLIAHFKRNLPGIPVIAS